MKVKDMMTVPVITVSRKASLEEAARTMLERDIGCVPVVDERGEICGILTESDFCGRQRGVPFAFFRWPKVFGEWLPVEGLEQIYARARTASVAEHMTPAPVTVSEDDPADLVVERMLDAKIHHLPVVQGRVPVGMVTRRELLRVMVRLGRGQGAVPKSGRRAAG